MNSGRGEADPGLSVFFRIIREHHGTISVRRPAPETLVRAEVVAAYPNHPGTVFTLPLTPGGATQPEHMRSG